MSLSQAGETIRQAGEAALMAYSAADGTPEEVAAAILTVYGDRLRQGDAATAGTVIAELVWAHSLALVRLANLQGVSLLEAAADLVSLIEGRVLR